MIVPVEIIRSLHLTAAPQFISYDNAHVSPGPPNLRTSIDTQFPTRRKALQFLKMIKNDYRKQNNNFDRIAGRELHDLGRGVSGDMKLIPQHIQSVVAKIDGVTVQLGRVKQSVSGYD